jgi:hypothetical protein
MHRITLTNKVTCVDIEQELGLERGTVTEVTEHDNGIVDVCFEQEPTADQKAALQEVLNMKITSEGAE